MLMGAPRNTLRVFNAGVSLCRLVCRRPQAAKPVLRRGSSRSAFPLWGKAVMAYPPTGSVQTECTRLPVMLRTKGRFLCQRTIGFVGLQKHINSGYAFAERQMALECAFQKKVEKSKMRPSARRGRAQRKCKQ